MKEKRKEKKLGSKYKKESEEYGQS